jgi:Zn finger protein HypA/HybF involved in hydrogenase expression
MSREETACPHCFEKVELDPLAVSKAGRCPHCKRLFHMLVTEKALMLQILATTRSNRRWLVAVFVVVVIHLFQQIG